MRLIWMTDLHHSSSGLVSGKDSRAQIQSAIRYVNDHYSDADGCIISGDLANRGDQRDYTELQALLSTMAIPYYPMVGNHDTREHIQSLLTIPDQCMPDFVQYALPTEPVKILCLDTQREGSDHGEFCEQRMRWLKSELDSSDDQPTYLFMHHPPIPLNLPNQDDSGIGNGDELMALLTHYPNVRHLFIGHVHRPINGLVNGIAFSTLRSTTVQVPAPRPAWTWDTFTPADESPTLAVVDIDQHNVLVHSMEFAN